MIEIFLGSLINNGEIDYSYIQKCSPDVHAITVAAIIEQESAFNNFAIGINSGTRLSKQPDNYNDAVSIAKSLIENGHNIDIGLGQINSKNLNWLNLSVEDAFLPCKNIKAINDVLKHNYELTYDSRFDHESNLKKAVSMYNTGSESRGFDNGYVVAVLDKAIRQLKNIPFGSDSELTVVEASNNTVPLFSENENIRRSRPLEADTVDTFKSYSGLKNSEKNGKNTRERSEPINDTQFNQ